MASSTKSPTTPLGLYGSGFSPITRAQPDSCGYGFRIRRGTGTRNALAFTTGALALFLLPAPALAQTSNGAIVGTVRDQTNAVLHGATVTVWGERLIGGDRRLETDEAGGYRAVELPPGPYVVQVSMPGFAITRRDNLLLAAAATLVVDLTLVVSGGTDVVEVDAPSPMVDVTSAAPPQNIDESFLRDLPTSRSVPDLINLQPGVLAGVAFGGTQSSNAIYADGLDLTEPMTQDPWLHLNYDWVQEAQVTTLASGAEYGNSTGASLNAVLRSGSNRLSGFTEFWAAPASWSSSNTEELSASLQHTFAPRRLGQWWSVDAQVGGPMVRDRLWYFGAFQHETLDYRPAGYNGDIERQQDDPQALFKVTSAPGTTVRLEGFVQGGRYRADNTGLDNFTTQEATGKEQRRQVSWNARMTWTPGANTMLEARMNGFNGPEELTPHGPGTCDGPPAHYDLTTGWWTGNVYACGRTERSRLTGAVTLTHEVRAGAGTHAVRAGVEAEHAFARNQSSYAADIFYLDDNGAPYMADLWEGESYTTTLPRYTVFAADEWRAAGRVTVVGGLRIDVGRGRVPTPGRSGPR